MLILLKGDGFDQDFTDCVIECLQEEIYCPGEKIFDQGSWGDAMYFIVEGAVVFWKDGVQVNLLNEYEYFGEIAVIYGSPRMASAYACEHCRVYKMTFEDFVLLIRSFPDVLDHITQICEVRRQRTLHMNLLKKGFVGK